MRRTRRSRTSEARVETDRKALELALAGPRAEDIAQAEAQLEGAQAELALLKRQLADAELVAPTDAVVRSRLMEPGELATPQRPVFSLAVTNPKWVRAYAAEAMLGRLQAGHACKRHDRQLPGRSRSRARWDSSLPWRSSRRRPCRRKSCARAWCMKCGSSSRTREDRLAPRHAGHGAVRPVGRRIAGRASRRMNAITPKLALRRPRDLSKRFVHGKGDSR